LNEKTTSSLKSISEEIDYIVTYSEYDDKENWASSLGLFFPTDGLSKNNPISYTFKYPDGITETYFDVYQYNDLNYPIERYIYNNFNSNSYYYNYENYCK